MFRVVEHLGADPRAPLDQPELLELVHGLADGEAVDGEILGEGQLRGELVSRRVDARQDAALEQLGDLRAELGSRRVQPLLWRYLNHRGRS